MNLLIRIIQWVVGLLFIFSGLVKANDPLGLSYKMQEFFEVWGLHALNHYTFTFAILMNAFEIIAGVAVIIGWRMRLFIWLLLLLIVFFTFLTGYAHMSGKIKSCGCFGDCLPLSSLQSFIKDILLLVFIFILLLNLHLVRPAFTDMVINVIAMIVAVVFSFGLQWYTLRYLPVVDCLPYKKGNNLLELSKMPKDAVPDQYSFLFLYKKNGVQQQFTLANLPDSSWTFVDRLQVLVKKGRNNEPKVKDFLLRNADGVDVTHDILRQTGRYYLLFLNDPSLVNRNASWIQEIERIAPYHRIYIVTSQVGATQELLSGHKGLERLPVFSCDGTAIKTAARASVVLYRMHGAVVEQKWAAPQFGVVQ